MIVKNEAKVIVRCLDSTRPLIDYVLIEDTGSTDGTQDIILAWLEKNGVPGEIIDEPWQDFAYNRSHALECLRRNQDIDYALIIDADDSLIIEAGFDIAEFKSSMKADLYDVAIHHNAVRHYRPHLCSNHKGFFFRGVLHEFVEMPSDARGRETARGFAIKIWGGGARSQDPEKFRKDAELLERALQTETEPFLRSRYTFYLAQSYRDCGEKQKSLDQYLARAEMGFWQEEVYVALYYAARLKEALDHPEEDVIATYQRATDLLPARVEALHGASRYGRLKRRHKQGAEIARRGLDLKMPVGALFAESWIYEFGLLDEFAVNAYWSGDYQGCLDACAKILQCPSIDASVKRRVEENARFARDKISPFQVGKLPSLVSIIIPSRLARNPATNALFLDNAIASIRTQTSPINVEIIVGVDSGSALPTHLSEDVKFAESHGRSQAAALNAASRAARGDVISFLEDDDVWEPTFLEEALAALKDAPFASSTQLELDRNGSVIRINDFPTPSGWVMTRETWNTVGEFDETFRWHLDNQWLGRLSEAKIQRIHLVEATAPIETWRVKAIRPWLSNTLGENVRLRRHASPWPLVRRLVREDTGKSAIEKNLSFKEQSLLEIEKIRERFGRIPW